MQILILFFLLSSCSPNESKDIANNRFDSQPLIGATDSCSIDILSKVFYNDYGCRLYRFIWNGTNILNDYNDDYTLLIQPFGTKNENQVVFDCYDSPTGRRKLLLFDLFKREIFMSEWFDDSASGDSVNAESVNYRAFSVIKNDNPNESYIVNFHSVKKW